MDFSFTRNGEALAFGQLLPKELLLYKVFPHYRVATGNWGAVLFQELVTPDFAAWHSVYMIREISHFHVRSDAESIQLHLTLKNTLHFNTVGLGNLKVKPHYFNLTYIPFVNTIGYFLPGTYESFNISYRKDYLNRFIPYLKSMEAFIEDIDHQIAGRLHPTHLMATHEMMQVVNKMLHYDYTEGLNNLILDSKAQELLTLALQRISRAAASAMSLSRDDATLIESVHDWLLLNMDFNGSLYELAQQFQTNDFKLKRGFKELYGQTVHELLVTLRMERAKQMLLETNISIVEIGYRAGYNSGSNFTDAFKKHFGVPPKFVRKG